MFLYSITGPNNIGQVGTQSQNRPSLSKLVMCTPSSSTLHASFFNSSVQFFTI